MPRRKYRFASRADAEDALRKSERAHLLAEWFASALIEGRITYVGKDGTTKVGYFTTRHSAVVFAYVFDLRIDSPHCIRGLWDADDMHDLIVALSRHEDTRELGRLLDLARTISIRKAVSA